HCIPSGRDFVRNDRALSAFVGFRQGVPSGGESDLHQWFSAGSHEIEFDASGLASGVYLYRMTAGEFTGSGKMVLLK
ncbi:MAG: hypothetical protein ABIE92_16165, partial [bacterium]